MFLRKRKKSKTKTEKSDRRVDYDLQEISGKIKFSFKIHTKRNTFTRFVLDSLRSNKFSGRITTLTISPTNCNTVLLNSNLKTLLAEFKQLNNLYFNLQTCDPKFYLHVLLAVKERAEQHSNLISLKLGNIYHGETEVVYFTAQISQYVLNTQAYLLPSYLKRFAAPYFFRVCERYGNKFAMGSAYSSFQHESRQYFINLLEKDTIVEYLM